MSPSKVSLIITIAFFVFAGIGFLFGYIKGAMKSMVDLIAALTCAVLSVPITKIIVAIILKPSTMVYILNRISSMLPADATETIEAAKELLTNEGTKEAASDIVKLVASLPFMLASPLIYMVVFILLGAYLYIVALFVKIVACQKTKSIPLRFLGGGLGALAFGVIFSMFLTPIWGYSDLAVDVIDYYQEVAEDSSYDALSNTSSNETLNVAKDYMKEINGNVVPAVAYNLGGKAIFNSVTTMKIDKTKVTLRKEAMSIVELADAANQFSGVSVEEYGPEQIEAINQINKTLEKSEFLPLLISKTVAFASNEYSQGHAILGVEKPNFGERFNPTFDRILLVVKDTDSDALRTDFRMLSNIAISAIENGVLENGTDTWAIFENSKFLSDAFIELYKNERTYNTVPYLVSAITNYTYERYNEINGFDKKPDEFDYSNYNEEQLKIEAENIAKMARELHSFSTSTEFKDGMDYNKVINDADFAALGRALQLMRDGKFTGRMFDIVFYAFLHSEAASGTGLVDDALIDKATKPNANLELLFSSRQNVLKLALAIQEKRSKEERKELMHSVVEDILLNDESTSTVISRDNLLSLGMTDKEADSVDAIVNSMVDGAHQCEFESEDERIVEVEKTEVIIDAVSNTVLTETNEKMFKVDENDTSTSEMTAKEFVDGVLDSRLSSAMVNSAVIDENGEIIEDPYQINDSLSNSDRAEMTKAINESYAKEGLTDEEKQALDSLAIIFCINAK